MIKSPKIIGRLKPDKMNSEIIVISPKHIKMNSRTSASALEESLSSSDSDSNDQSAPEDEGDDKELRCTTIEEEKKEQKKKKHKKFKPGRLYINLNYCHYPVLRTVAK